ncbi:MAG TPA: hypothetical protein VGY57_05485 [Vicinamibacterales bacterium]|nr:hypothetical protein [Vicinamibacterales bacterium]
MRIRPVLTLGAAVIAVVHAAGAAGPPVRTPLDPAQRNAVLVLMHAVDVAQESDATSDAIDWTNHLLKAPDQTAYVPFRVTLPAAQTPKSAALYVRAVSRHDGFRSKMEHSVLREWVERGGGAPPPLQQTMRVSPGEMPVGGPGVSSSRQNIQAATEASTMLTLQQRQFEKEKAAAEAAKKKEEAKERNPDLFPFEEYYFADVKGSRAIERALALPPGEYDVFIALVDRSKVGASAPAVIRRTIRVPDYWNDELSLSPVILVKEFRQLKAPLSAKDQPEHPYTFGAADIEPVSAAAFSSSDVLTVFYQICNYGAPDVDVTTEYHVYRDVNGARTLFNRTDPQQLGDADLPAPSNWSTQGFVMQTLPLAPFPSGRYELEIVAKDRLTRRTATTMVEFTVK